MRGLLAILLVLAGCAPQKLERLNPLSTELSIDREKEIGLDAHHQIRRSGLLVTDPVLLTYVDEIGQRLVRSTGPQPFLYRFNLVRSDALNAFAVPGGYVYVHTGVLQQVGDVSELVGVLAHEVAHVRRRHIAEAVKKEGPAQLATLIAAIGAAAAGADPGVIAVASGINVALQLKHSREQEADADRQGISYMIATGYDPHGMLRFFQRIQTVARGGAGGIPPYLYTHPAIDVRILAGDVEIERVLAPVGLTRDDPRLPEMQARLTRLLERVAGGTGLHVRPAFDPQVDPMLRAASALVEGERLDDADELLLRASPLAPGDPRIPLERAAIAERRGDAETAAALLQRAVDLDPSVPLVQYRLGLAYKRLGNLPEAVFYLELAAEGFAEHSSGRRRADLAVEQISFPMLETSGLSDDRAEPDRERFVQGEEVVWWGEVAARYIPYTPRFRVVWRDPDGEIASEEMLSLGSLRRVTARFDTRPAEPGRWSVEVRVDDCEIDARTFELLPAGG